MAMAFEVCYLSYHANQNLYISTILCLQIVEMWPHCSCVSMTGGVITSKLNLKPMLIVGVINMTWRYTLPSHTLCREEGSGHATTIELPQSSSYVTKCFVDVSILFYSSFVPRPLPDFISQLWIKIGRNWTRLYRYTSEPLKACLVVTSVLSWIWFPVPQFPIADKLPHYA